MRGDFSPKNQGLVSIFWIWRGLQVSLTLLCISSGRRVSQLIQIISFCTRIELHGSELDDNIISSKGIYNRLPLIMSYLLDIDLAL